ncbi:hypothetical protein C1645_832226 [Glomus cerebriforme]|uniref:Uncharacterized protein n=1 Tax=Glomus cerebriforme TaxID=658196 RepID=A0A397SII4_9GLOM|nr:hypothetical protein C1645_832226 [Glomus cerebriforme]
MQPAVLFNKKLTGNWQKVFEEMKNTNWRVRFIEATPGTPGASNCYIEQWDHLKSEDEKNKIIECISVNILPFHDPQEAVTLIDIVATGLFPDNQPQIAQKLNEEHKNHINNPTNLTSANKWVYLVTQLSTGSRNLRLHDCYVLQERLHTIYNIATATLSQLLDCSLDHETA